MKKAEHRKPSKKIRRKKRETRWRNFKSMMISSGQKRALIN
jgi:hypothetical protein